MEFCDYVKGEISMSNLNQKVIITAALTGAITPSGYNIPETPEQIAEAAYECWKLGAAVVHLHMRDEKGIGTMDAARFRKDGGSAPRS